MTAPQIQRLQIYLEPGLYELLRRESFRRKRSLSSLVRDAIAERFAPARPARGAAGLLRASGTLHGKVRDVSRCHDAYLWGEP